jgi:hypothetical protein
MSGGWIGVDLDGTLARYDGWKGIEHVGEMIPNMREHVQQWLRLGQTVKIFTARVACQEPERERVISVIQDWLEANGLPRLEVTNTKDFGMIALYDDRAVRVVFNEGILVL